MFLECSSLNNFEKNNDAIYQNSENITLNTNMDFHQKRYLAFIEIEHFIVRYNFSFFVKDFDYQK